MMRMILFCIALFNFAHGASTYMDCTIKNKNQAEYAKCEGNKSGYLNRNEETDQFVVEYASHGKKQKVTVDNKATLDEVLNKEKLKNIISNKLGKKIDSAEIDTVSLSSNTALFKDPTKTILASGCRMTTSPIIVSCKELNNCNSMICVGTAECKVENTKTTRDVMCKANISSTGATCPSANVCMNDTSVVVEKYQKPVGPKIQNGSSDGAVSK